MAVKQSLFLRFWQILLWTTDAWLGCTVVQIRGQVLKISHDCFFPRSSTYIILAHPRISQFVSFNAGMLVAETTKVLSNHSTNIRKPICVTWGTKVEQVALQYFFCPRSAFFFFVLATELNLLVPIVDYVPPSPLSSFISIVMPMHKHAKFCICQFQVVEISIMLLSLRAQVIIISWNYFTNKKLTISAYI